MSASEIKKYLKEKKDRKKGKRPWVSFKAGTYYLRIGPPWQKEGEVWKDVLFHGNFKTKVYCAKNDVDPETGKQRKCKVCRRLAELKNEARTKRSKKLFTLLVQKSEGLWNVLIAKVKKRDDGSIKVIRYEDNKFKIWRATYKWHLGLVDIFSDDDFRKKSILGVTHPKYGRLIKMKRIGEGPEDTQYNFNPLDNPSSISKDEDERKKLLKTLNDLDKVVTGSSDEELASFLRRMEKKAKGLSSDDEDEDDNEREDDDVDDEDEDEEKNDEKEDSEEELEDEDEEGDEEESDNDDEEDDLEKQYRKMKKGLKKKKKSKDEDEEEESEDESSDEDDE